MDFRIFDRINPRRIVIGVYAVNVRVIQAECDGQRDESMVFLLWGKVGGVFCAISGVVVVFCPRFSSM